MIRFNKLVLILVSRWYIFRINKTCKILNQMFLVYYLLNSKEIFSTYVLSLSENSSILDSMKICAVSNNNNNNNNLKISIEPLKYQKVNK